MKEIQINIIRYFTLSPELTKKKKKKEKNQIIPSVAKNVEQTELSEIAGKSVNYLWEKCSSVSCKAENKDPVILRYIQQKCLMFT